MTQATGTGLIVHAAFEAAYGTPANTQFMKMPISSSGLGSAFNRYEDRWINTGSRDPQMRRNAEEVNDGDIAVPLSAEEIGVWLRCLLGVPITTGATAPYTHEFRSGAIGALPSLTLEMKWLDNGVTLQHSGVKVNNLSFPLLSEGEAPVLTLSCIGRTETPLADLTETVPTGPAFTYLPFKSVQGKIEKDGTALGEISTGTLDFVNNMVGQREVNGGAPVSRVKEQSTGITGSITARFTDRALYDLALAETELRLLMGYELPTGELLTIDMPRVTLEKTRVAVDGPDGIDVEWPFDPGIQKNGDSMAIFTLINNVASYEPT